MKKVLAAFALMFGAVSANAAVDMFDGSFSTCTVNQVSVSSTVANPAATALFTATLTDPTTTFLTLMEDRDVLFLQNVSTFAYVNCLVGLSSTAANGDLSLTQPVQLTTTLGIQLPFNASVGLKGFPNIAPRNRDNRVQIPWCANSGASGAAKVNVIQCKRL